MVDRFATEKKIMEKQTKKIKRIQQEYNKPDLILEQKLD